MKESEVMKNTFNLWIECDTAIDILERSNIIDDEDVAMLRANLLYNIIATCKDEKNWEDEKLWN